MLFSPSSLLSTFFLCSLLIMFIVFYLRDINRMVQIGIKGIFIIIGLIIVRLIFPYEFTSSYSFASRYFMPNILGLIHTPVIFVLNKSFTAVFEPYAISPDHAANTVELTEDSSYLVTNLNVYHSLEEAKKHEKKK